MGIEKILIVVPSLSNGGMERYVINISESMSKKGLDVAIFILAENSISFEVNSKIKINTPNKIPIIPKIINDLFRLHQLRNILKKNKYDFLYSVGGMHSPYVIFAALFLKVNIFVSDRSSPLIRYSCLVEFLKFYLYPRVNGVVAQTEIAKQILIERLRLSNILVIPNPIRKIQQYNHIRKNQIITVSRLIKSKRLDLLLQIFSTIQINNFQWELVIVGDGPEMNSLIDLSKKLNIRNKTVFIGNSCNVDFYLSQAKIFAFTSAHEGFPNSLCEGMRAGLACISFDCIAGPSDIITDNVNGFLVKNNNIQEYKLKLEQLIINEHLRLRFSNAGILFTNRLDTEIVTDNLLTEFRKRRLF